MMTNRCHPARAALCLLALLLCLLTAFACAAEGENPENARVYNPVKGDRLHLREKANAKSASLGRYYSGTPVHILSKEGDFARVRVGVSAKCPQGSAEGYMMLDFLLTSDTDPNYFSHSMNGYVYPDDWQSQQPVYAAMDTGAEVVSSLYVGRHVQVLADIGEDWLHVMADDISGFVPAQCVTKDPLGEEVYMGYIVDNRDTERVHLRVAPDIESRSLGVFHTGTPVFSYAADRSGEWVFVDVTGGMDPTPLRGYMRRRFLSEDNGDPARRASVIGYQEAAGEGGKATVWSAPSAQADARGVLVNGAPVVAYGEIGDWAIVCTDAFMGYMRKSDLKVSERDVGVWTYGTTPYNTRDGYLIVDTKGEEEVYTYAFCEEKLDGFYLSAKDGETLLLVRDLGEWAQVQGAFGSAMFIRTEGMRLYDVPALRGEDQKISLLVGEYAVGKDLPPDLYCLSAVGGGQGEATVRGADGASRTYVLRGDAFYNLYLPEGATVTLDPGARLGNLTRDWMWQVNNDTSHRGDGRFLAGMNIDPNGVHVKLLEGKDEGYYTLCRFEDEAQVTELEKIPLKGTDFEYLILEPGMFIELHNAHIWVNG